MLRLSIALVATSSALADCDFYRKVQDGICANACLPATVGICPRAVIVKAGGLDAGKCADVGYTVDKGTVSQPAGPCGTLEFNQYAKAGSALASASPFVPAKEDLPCCKACTEPKEKYLSIDTAHNMCGECCMEPKDYNLYHVFEKNLEKANSTTPCADRGYANYSETVTHGALWIKMTLDLYKPTQSTGADATKAEAAQKVGAGDYTCPGSSSTIHASCKQTATIATSCATVGAEIKARIAGQYGTWHDPHNNGTYSILSATDSQFQLQRVTGNLKYTDKMTLTLSGSGDSCTLSGCSESQVTSVADFSTNFCNVRVLYCGTKDGCKFAKTDLESSVTDTSPSLGAGSDIKDCLKA